MREVRGELRGRGGEEGRVEGAGEVEGSEGDPSTHPGLCKGGREREQDEGREEGKDGCQSMVHLIPHRCHDSSMTAVLLERD